MQDYFHPDPPARRLFPIASAGYPLIIAGAFVTLVFALLGTVALSLVALGATLAVCGFFRDPDRVVPCREDAVVSPADGRIIFVGADERGSFLEAPAVKVSIFMSVFNVHVNRIPQEGEVQQVRYYPGRFYAADLPKASLQNEHNAVFIKTAGGEQICVVQVAGLIARRIVCTVQPGDRVCKGQRFGMICFGSRLDVYLPARARIEAAVGDRVLAGTSVFGYLP